MKNPIEILKIAILTSSDKCSRCDREDKSGSIIKEMLDPKLYNIVAYDIVSDEKELIKEKLKNYCDLLNVNLVLTNGGTGFSLRDIMPEATYEVIDREVPGLSEVMRIEGFKKTKRAVLSRGIAGLRGTTLIINLPGSSRGAKESLEVIISELPHSIAMIAGQEH